MPADHAQLMERGGKDRALVAQHEAGAASGLLNAAQQMGGSRGLSILMTLFTSASEDEAKRQQASFRLGHRACGHQGPQERPGELRGTAGGAGPAA
ncbi:hypothetical protein ACQUSR_07685 [Streptomyces sp. P1-3]|uniref:hypothetical protein n=1 Tax=Streptomyces sp. P1-3 TaxID=3421658 RepID=UPI003D367E7B